MIPCYSVGCLLPAFVKQKRCFLTTVGCPPPSHPLGHHPQRMHGAVRSAPPTILPLDDEPFGCFGGPPVPLARLLFAPTVHTAVSTPNSTTGWSFQDALLASCLLEGLRVRAGRVVATLSALEANDPQEDLVVHRSEAGALIHTESPCNTSVQQGLNYLALQLADVQTSPYRKAPSRTVRVMPT